MRHPIMVLMLVCALPIASLHAKKPQLSGLELQQIQARGFDAGKTLSFAAVMTVLQDAGFRINSADKDTGFITGVGTSEGHITWLPFVGFGSSKKNPVVTAFIEERGQGSRIRLSFVMAKASNNRLGGFADEDAVVDPAVYRDAFEKIEKEIFIREAEDARPPMLAASSASAKGVRVGPQKVPVAGNDAAPAPDTAVVVAVALPRQPAPVPVPAAAPPPPAESSAAKAQDVAASESAGIPVYDGDIERPYRVLGSVTAVLRRETAFLNGPITPAKAHAALWRKALKLHADAVVQASLGKPHTTFANYQEAEAKGLAIAYVPAAQ